MTAATSRRSRRIRAGLRVPAMAWPYLGLIGGTIVLNRASQDSVAGLWWLAPTALVLYLLALALTVTLMTTRRRRARGHDGELERLSERLLGATGAPPHALRDELRPLMSRLRDVQRACARALSPAETEAVRTELIKLGAHDALTRQLRRTRGKRRRADVLFTLGWIGDERSVGVLADALNGHDPDLAYVAGQALADYDSEQACRSLVEALRSAALPRPLVATLLESSRHSGAAELVARAAGDPDAGARSWVAYLLGRCSDPRAGEWLAALAADADPEVRATAAEAYGSHADPEVLSTLLGDDDWRVRANAAKAVGNSGLSGLVPNLTTLMADRTWWVRQSAALALKQLGQASVEHLRLLLEHDDRFVRNKAAEILIEVGFISEQIAALGGTAEQAAAARHVLAAVARAEARETLAGSVETADPVTRERLEALLAEVDNATAIVRLAA